MGSLRQEQNSDEQTYKKYHKQKKLEDQEKQYLLTSVQ